MNSSNERKDKRDATASIRGFFYQVLHTLKSILELEDEQKVYIEFGEDIAEVGKDSQSLKQIKHSSEKISLTSKSVQEFLVNSYRLSKDSLGRTSHHFITTSELGIEKGRSTSWIQKFIDGNLMDEDITYLKNKKSNVRKSYEESWNELLGKPVENIRDVLKNVYFSPSQSNYKTLIDELKTDISRKYPDVESDILIEKMVFFLFQKSSEDGVKEITKKDLNSVIEVELDRTSIEYKLTKELLEGNTDLLKDIRNDIKAVQEDVAVLATREEDSELLKILDVIEENFKNDLPKTALNLANSIANRVTNSSNKVKERYYSLVAKSQQILGKKIDASKNYLMASSYSEEDLNKIYYEAFGLIYQEVPELTKAEELADKLIKKYPNLEKGYKVKLLAAGERLEERFIVEIPDHIKNAPDIQSLIAYAYNLKKDYKNAILWAEKLANCDTIKPEHKSYTIEYQLVDMLDGVFINHNPSPRIETKVILNQFLESLKEIWDDIKHKETAPARTTILNWISNIEFLLGIPDYVKTIDKSIELSLDKDSARYIKSNQLIATGDKEGAKEILKTIDVDVTRTQIFELDLDVSSEIEDVAKQVDQVLEDINDEYKQYPVLSFLRFTSFKNIEELKKYFDKYSKYLPDYIKDFFEAVQIDDEESQFAQLEELLKAAIERDNKVVIDLIVSQFQYLNKGGESIKGLEALANPDFFTIIDSEILKLSKRFENEAERYKRLENYLLRFGNIPQILNEKLPLDEIIDDKKSQLDIVNELLKTDSDNLYLLIQQGILNLEAGEDLNIDRIKDLYKVGADQLEYGINIAFLYAKSNKLEDALELLYLVRRKHPNAQSVNQAYLSLMLNYFRAGHEEWISTKSVTNNYVVSVKHQDKVTDYTVELDLETSELLENEVNKEHPIYKKIEGKGIGDTLEGLGQIVGIIHKYVYVHQKLLNEHDKFLPEGSIMKFNVQVGGDTDFSEIVEMLEDIEKSNKERIKLYQSNIAMPLIALGKSIGKKYFDTYHWALSNPEIQIRCSDGSVNEIKQTNDVLSLVEGGNAKRFVLDMSSLLTFDWLDLLTELGDLVDEILVVPSLVEELNQWIEDQENMGEEETMTLGVENGKPLPYKYSKDFNKARLSKFKSLKKWVEDNTEVKPTKKILEMDKDKRDRFYNFIGSYALESIYLAAETDAVLISDERTLRAIGKNEHDVNGLYIQPILQLMLKDKLIDKEQYDTAINKLVNANYYYIGINADNLMNSIRKSGYYMDDTFKNLLKVLSSSSPQSIAIVTSKFLTEIYQEPVITERRDAIVISLLNELKSNAQFNEILNTVRKLVEQNLYLQPLALYEVNDTINLWVSTRPFQSI